MPSRQHHSPWPTTDTRAYSVAESTNVSQSSDSQPVDDYVVSPCTFCGMPHVPLLLSYANWSGNRRSNAEIKLIFLYLPLQCHTHYTPLHSWRLSTTQIWNYLWRRKLLRKANQSSRNLWKEKLQWKQCEWALFLWWKHNLCKLFVDFNVSVWFGKSVANSQFNSCGKLVPLPNRSWRTNSRRSSGRKEKTSGKSSRRFNAATGFRA